jgi:hypothetical protein
VASGSSHRGEATGEEARWPSDEEYIELDQNTLVANWFAPKYPGANEECVIALIREGAAPKLTALSPFFHFILL